MNIFNLFKYGFKYSTCINKRDYYEREFIEEISQEAKVNFHGRLDEIDFLKRVFELEELEGTDSRFDNVLEDIYQHRIRNDDWEDDWVFDYEPFNLEHCDDEILLNFIAEAFNPYVRDENKPWRKLLEKINGLVMEDGYKFYVKKKISGNEIFGFKEKMNKRVLLEEEIHETLSSQFIDENIRKCKEKLEIDDYSGAITNARTLVEEILLSIEEKITGDRQKNDGNISKMYRRVKSIMNFDPSNNEVEETLKQILGGLNSIVIGLGNLRSKASDSHATNYKPDKHHAVLAVNAAFTFVDFIFSSYKYQVEKGYLKFNK
jgi:hypothetical protein